MEIPINGKIPAPEMEVALNEAATHFRYYLMNGFCMDESFDMTVTDMETGEVLQERTVSLSQVAAYPEGTSTRRAQVQAFGEYP